MGSMQDAPDVPGLAARPNGFGAVIRGVDLSKDAPAQHAAAWVLALARHGVLVFPEQRMTVEDLERVTGVFGGFGVDPFVEPLAGHPHVIEVRREADEKSIVFGGAWHSDWSFQARPPAATLLLGQIIPPVGGNTAYVDTARAYEAMSSEWRERASRLRAIHSASAAYGTQGALARDSQPSSMKIITGEAAHGTQVHPVVRTHPITGRRSLFINPVYTRAIDGVSDEESKEILAQLYIHMLDEQFQYEHEWSSNMLVVWDNRTTMHLARGGYEGHRRLLYRTTVAGEAPMLDTDQPSA
jgi:taurine dioxygenase